MENTKYGRRREGRWTPIRAKAQDTRANPNSWETHPVRKRWDIGLLRALSLWIMMMIMMIYIYIYIYIYIRVSQNTMKKMKSGSIVTATLQKVSFVHDDTKCEVLPNLNNI